MEINLFLLRKYYPAGTNGEWTTAEGKHICYNIELPWKQNQHEISCIPEYRYQLIRIDSPKHGDCLQVARVLNRGMVEVHSANYALKELRGCLAPVQTLDSPGVGFSSRRAVQLIETLVFPELTNDHTVWLTIKNAKGKPYEYYR